MRFNQKMAMRAVLVALPLVGLTFAVFVVSAPRRALAKLWTEVPGTQGCNPTDGSLWRSSQEMVCAPRDERGLKILSVNAVNGKRRILTSPPANEQVWGSGVMVSPDGKWLLWPNMKSQAGWNVMRLDGKGWVQRPRATQSASRRTVAWLPDSSGWVEASPYGLNGRNGDTVLIIHKLNTAKTRVIDVPEADGINDFQVTKRGEAVFSCSEPVSVRLVTVPLSGPRKVRQQNIAPPFNAGNKQHIMATLVSPQGDRIAWTSQISKGGSTTESVWLSDIKGKNFKRLTPELRKHDLAPVYLHWMPDGKNLSFWRRESLWKLHIR